MRSSIPMGNWLTEAEYIPDQYQHYEQAERILLSCLRPRSHRCEWYRSRLLMMRSSDWQQGLQDLSETRVHKLNSLWTLATALETQTLNRGVDQLNHLSSEIPRNEPYLDSMMFVRHNTTNWQDPPDMFFEPSPVWHDDAAMCTDEQAKIFLRNILTKSKAQTKELKQDVEKKRREVEGAKAVRLRIRNGTDKRDEADVVRDLFRLQEDVHQSERKQLTAEVEVSTITSVVGDLSLGAKNHNFKTQTFKIPTNCDLCGERIWGLSAKGFDCRDCGYTCHSKCEMKVPATCPGEQSKEEKKKLKSERQEAASATPIYEGGTNGSSTDGPQLSRQDTLNSLSSGYAASAHRSVAGRAPEPAPTDNGDTAVKPSTTGTVRKNRIVAPPPAQYVSAPPVMDDDSSRSSEQRGKMLYAYDANGEGEISVSEGQDVSIVEADGKSNPTLSTNHKAQTNISIQTAQAGQPSAPAIPKALSQQPTSNSCPPPRHQHSHPPSPNDPNPPTATAQPPSPAAQPAPQSPPPNAKDPPSRLVAARRNWPMSKRCMSMRRGVMLSGVWLREIGLCWLSRMMGVGGRRLRRGVW